MKNAENNIENRGLTFMLTFGKYAGFDISKNSTNFRICLGWVSFVIIFSDFEVAIKNWFDQMRELEAENAFNRMMLNAMMGPDEDENHEE